MTALLPLVLLGCFVGKAKYDALNTELGTTRSSLNEQIAMLGSRVTDLETALAHERTKLRELTEEKNRLEAALATEKTRAAGLVDEKAGLVADRARLKGSVDEMKAAMAALEARKAEAEKRIGEYQTLLSRFKRLIDAGKLKVKIVDGRMIVELATDILFASGSAELSADGTASIAEVSTVLASIPTRTFQVEGHTDNVPIKTDKYPSNWELASARALTVVRTMISSGMPAHRVSAASFGEHKPTAPNQTPEGRAQNRRIEIVVVPDLAGLPGFDELRKASAE